MKSRRRQKVWDDHQTVSGCCSRTSNPKEYSEQIPIDLMISIFLRLPVKCIARCRCVSKLWSSILGRPDFTELFLTKSSARPQLLFASQNHSELLFFSSSPSVDHLAANYHLKIPIDHVGDVFSPINGLVCIRGERILEGRKNPVNVWVICNPSTGQSFTLPKMKTRTRVFVRSFFCYDPIEKQIKVLAMTWAHETHGRDRIIISKEHQVLTLGGGTGKLSWRLIKCDIPHYPDLFGICINGVLYYKALRNHYECSERMIICFDVKSEKFSSIKITETFTTAVLLETTLINYKGKLASILLERMGRSLEMWILEDPEKHEWSNHTYILPLLQNNYNRLFFVGTTSTTNEIVLSPRYLYPHDPFYVFYCSFDRKTIRRIKIQGMEMEALKGNRVYTLINHVEDVKLMKLL